MKHETWNDDADDWEFFQTFSRRFQCSFHWNSEARKIENGFSLRRESIIVKSSKKLYESRWVFFQLSKPEEKRLFSPLLHDRHHTIVDNSQEYRL